MANVANEDWLEKAIKRAIELRISELVADKIKEAKEKIDAEIPTIIAGTAFDVFKQIDLLRDQRQILIRLKDDKP